MQLSKENFRKAVHFIETNAREIDKQLFSYYFDKNPVLDMSQLRKFTNSDGGFGHAIEPDIRMSKSSTIATATALEYCVRYNLPDNNSIIQNAIKYLLNILDKEYFYWALCSEYINKEAHAPWWAYKKAEKPNAPNPEDHSGFLFTAMHKMSISGQIVGYLNKYKKHVPTNLLSQLNDKINERIEEGILDLASDDPSNVLYTILNWEKSYEFYPEDLKNIIAEKIENAYKAFFDDEKDIDEKKASWLAPHTASILAKLYPEKLDRLYDKEIEKQSGDGGWWPEWQWGQFKKEWEIAKLEWAGRLTTDCLIALKEHDKIEW
ncbi:MAG: hypothetical protein ABFS35_16415 [Bacteroidota bacterium]